MKKANQDIRDSLKKANVKQWELAVAFGCSETWMCAMLRRELSSEEKFKLLTLIQQIVDERKVNS